MNGNDEGIKELSKLYLNPNSNLFLSKDTKDIYENIKSDASLHPATFADILRLRNSIESDFRHREHRILRGKRRYLSRRKFIAFSPCSILLGKFNNKENKDK